jgi:hypothetical protein
MRRGVAGLLPASPLLAFLPPASQLSLTLGHWHLTVHWVLLDECFVSSIPRRGNSKNKQRRAVFPSAYLNAASPPSRQNPETGIELRNAANLTRADCDLEESRRLSRRHESTNQQFLRRAYRFRCESNGHLPSEICLLPCCSFEKPGTCCAAAIRPPECRHHEACDGRRPRGKSQQVEQKHGI